MRLSRRTWELTGPNCPPAVCRWSPDCAATEDSFKTETRDLLQTLGTFEHQVSAKKAQICSGEVMHLGYILKWGQQELSETILKLPAQTT